MKLVCIGDSLTYGYGLPSKACWVELLKAHFNIEIVNKGINGDTTSGILSRYYRDVVEEKPNYVIIMAGTNDILMNHPLSLIQNNINLSIREAEENNIIPIIALQPPIISELAKAYWDDDVNYEKASLDLLDYINWLKYFSSENSISMINFYDKFLNRKDIKNLFSDGIHPNTDGHRLMFNNVIELLNRII